MDLIVVLLSESDPDASCCTHTIPLLSTTKNEFYSRDRMIAFDGFDMDLYLSFRLSMGLELCRVVVPENQLRYTRDSMRQLNRKHSIYGNVEQVVEMYQHVLKLDHNVSINYTARKYTSEELQQLGQIFIYSISILLSGDLVNEAINRRGDKITCMVNDKYLGRPQTIATNNESRRYLWTSKKDEPFEGIPIRDSFASIVEETKDLMVLKIAIPVGVSPRLVNNTPIVWDNDGYSNEARRLPTLLNATNLKLSFFNFKYLPPRAIECIVRWGRFVTAIMERKNRIRVLSPSKLKPRKLEKLEKKEEVPVYGMISEEIVPNIHIWIEFVMTKEMIKLTTISLHAKKYEETLEFDFVRKGSIV